MCLDTLTEDEWISIYDESDEIGYALIAPEGKWNRSKSKCGTKGKE